MTKNNILISSLFLSFLGLFMIAAITLADEKKCENQPFIIDSISPTSGEVGTLVTLTGCGFTTTGNTIRFGEVTIRNISSYNEGTTLSFKVPKYIVNYCDYWTARFKCTIPAKLIKPGVYNIYVTNADGMSATTRFYVSRRITR